MSQQKDETWHKEPHEQDSFWAYLVVPEAEGFDLMAPTWLIDRIIADHEAVGRVRELEAALERINDRHNDEEFMKGVLEASRQEAAGEQGEPWPQVKARLDLRSDEADAQNAHEGL